MSERGQIDRSREVLYHIFNGRLKNHMWRYLQLSQIFEKSVWKVNIYGKFLNGHISVTVKDTTLKFFVVNGTSIWGKKCLWRADYVCAKCCFLDASHLPTNTFFSSFPKNEHQNPNRRRPSARGGMRFGARFLERKRRRYLLVGVMHPENNISRIKGTTWCVFYTLPALWRVALTKAWWRQLDWFVRSPFVFFVLSPSATFRTRPGLGRLSRQKIL